MTGIYAFCIGIVAIYLLLAYMKPAIAFVTAPIAAFLIGYIAAVANAAEIAILVPVVFIGTLIVVSLTARDRESRQWFHWGARYLLLGITTMVVMGVILAGLGVLESGYVVAVVLLSAVVGFLTSMIHYSWTSRRRTAASVFSTLGAIVRQNLPLPMALDCAAVGADSGVADAFRGIKAWLVKGCSLTDAIRRGYPECSPGSLAMVAAGERIGQLPAALAAIETDVKTQTVGPRRLRPVHPFYPVFVVALTFVLLTGILTFVMPQFVTVLKEMVGGQLPVSTRILLRIVDGVTNESYGVLLLFLAVGIALARIAYRTARKHPERPSLALWVGDSLAWRFPITHWFEKDRSLVQTLEVLRISLMAGGPVNEAIRSTLPLDVNLWFRKRLQCWLQRVERGEDIAQSARRCRLGRGLAWAFDAGGNAGDTPALLEVLENHYRSLYSYRLNVMRYVLWPVGILLLGGMVGFVVYSIFSPTVAVIHSMSLYVYP